MSTVDPNKSHQSWSVFFIKGGLVKELNGTCLSFQSGHHQSKKPFLPIYNALKVQRNEKGLQKNETIQWNHFQDLFYLVDLHNNFYAIESIFIVVNGQK